MSADPIQTVFASYFDRAFAKLGKILAPCVPRPVTANAITLAGLAADVVAGGAFYLSAQSRLWFAVALAGIVIHLLADSLDGAVARARGQASKLGAFLDQMTDNFAFVALPLGIGLSGQARMEILVFGIIMLLLHAILLYNWIIWTGRRMFPLFGSADYELSLIATTILMIVLPDIRLDIAGHGLNWFEMACIVGAAWSFVDLCLSMRKLIRELRDT